MIDGLLVVDKPSGCTSHDVVARLRRAVGQRRVGHAGTLDPDATGVLLVGLGRVTRLLRFLQESGKAYRAEIAFGVATDTLDASGTVLERRPMPLDVEEVRAAARRFRGWIDQRPPMVSAVKVGGRRLYELARRGEEVERAPRRVRVDRFDVEALDPGPFPVATAVVECGSGTYVRSLAADLGAALGGPAHLRALRRTRVGSFTEAEAVPLAVLQDDPRPHVRPPLDAVRDLRRVDVGAEVARGVSHGLVFPATALLGDGAGGAEPAGPAPFAVVGPGEALLAVYEPRGAAVKPVVVLAGAEVA